jgi:hypothetical protein
MEKPIDRIVDAYVRVKNHRALEDLMTHRRRIAVDLGARRDFDFTLPLGQINDEIAVIEAGLRRLRAAEG